MDSTVWALMGQVSNVVTRRCFLKYKCRGLGSRWMSGQRLGWCIALGLILEYLEPCDWLKSPKE